MRTRRRPARQLRTAIDCLPFDTRRAMLEGLDANRIIVGAYTDRDGGICPMLAAHRHGGRTALASFARSWDRYTGAGNGPRPATERELRTLRTMLEASIALDEPGFTELSEVIAEHQASAAQRSERRPRRKTGERRETGERPETGERRETGETHRASELRDAEGWAWTRPFRRLDDFELVVREVRAMERERARRSDERELEPV
jgi:hypothetical protein